MAAFGAYPVWEVPHLLPPLRTAQGRAGEGAVARDFALAFDLPGSLPRRRRGPDARSALGAEAGRA